MDERREDRRTRFLSIRVKLLVGFTLLFSVVFAAAFYWFYDFATAMALGRIEEDLVDTLNAAIAGVDGDEFEALAREGEPGDSGVPDDDPRYWRHQGWLHTVQRIEPRSIPYTFVEGEEPYEVLWIGDIFRVIRPADQTAFRESYIAEPERTRLYRGLTEATTSMVPYPDQWGHWVSAYGPIENSKGEVVGGLGIDFRADYVFEVQQAILDKVVVSFAITYATLFVMVFLVSGALTQPIITLTEAAERIGEGDYEQDLSHLIKGRLPDEIDTLARVFAIMVGKVHQREQTLRRQVEELRIEIDEVKRKKQVSEIVESDFFQELKDKARRMRSRSHRSTQDALGDEAPE